VADSVRAVIRGETKTLQFRFPPDKAANVQFRLERLQDYLIGEHADDAVDLIRIAAMVYVADTTFRRGGAADVYGDDWTRDFTFQVSVCHPDLWAAAGSDLEAALQYLTGDTYSFEWGRWEGTELPRTLMLLQSSRDLLTADTVSLFSGGMDSLAAAGLLINEGSKPVLISHQSAPRATRSRRELHRKLESAVGRQVPLWETEIQRAGKDAIERTRRSRAFLHASLGIAAGLCLEVERVSMSDNGISSLNLLYSKIAAGSEATRSTHPRFLRLLNEFVGSLTQTGTKVVNLLEDRTRADVIQLLDDLGLADLIGCTNSCGTARKTTSERPHCGTCSQCIDRRFSVEAVGQRRRDTLYGVDIFTEAIPSTPQITLAESYVRLAGDVVQMSVDRFIDQFNGVMEAVEDADGAVADRVLGYWDLHRRHGEQMLEALSRQYREHIARLAAGELPDRCLLRLVPGRRRKPIDEAARAIVERIRIGLPLAFRRQEPIDETDLQDKVHAILSAYRQDFQREHPSVRFLGKDFRPDFAPGLADLFLEIKYPRGNRRKTRIVEEIAADVTASRATRTPYLFVVYDPQKLMVDEATLHRDLGLLDGEPVYLAFVR
jgi:7-cyano-7-deazaguanine synthase in queuosine biosynthesis